MAKDDIEEETYSVIFKSLKHPVRRRILRMLAEKPLAYSEILESLAIDSGHLNYHLENLGELITRSQTGKYQLSSIGIAAIKLMGGVEEQRAMSSRKLEPRKIFTKVYPVFLATVLIIASVSIATFKVPTYSINFTQDSQTPCEFTIAAGGSFEFDIKIYSWTGPFPTGITGFSLLRAKPLIFGSFLLPMTNRFDSSSEELILLDINFSSRAVSQFRSHVINQSGIGYLSFPYNESARAILQSLFDTTNTELPIEISKNLLVTVYKPDGSVANADIHQFISAFENDPWKSNNHYVSSIIQVTEAGNYRFIITNNGSFNWNGTLLPCIQWQKFENPHFLYGVLGIVIASTYLVLSVTYLRRNKK